VHPEGFQNANPIRVIRLGAGEERAAEVEILGPSRIVFDPPREIAGVRVYVETEAEVRIVR
jgi:hypothetical protein